MNRRRGVTLVELLTIIPMLLAVMAIIATLTPTLTKDIPALGRAVQTQRQLTGVFQRIERDVDSAVSLPDSAGGKQAGPATLLLQTPRAVICYEFADGRLTRFELSAQALPPQVWQMPNAAVVWKRGSEGAAPTAVEMRTAVRMNIGCRNVERLAISHVYFLHALPAPQVRK